jgi:LmbE family N-acetylglucosaminyl deacetylase
VRILAIGAHADDVEIGCGGSLLRWSRLGHELSICIVSDSAYRNPAGEEIRSSAAARAEAEQAAAMLKADLHIGTLPALHLAFGETLNAALVEQIGRIRPDLVLSHWPGDSHADHAAVGLATIHACRRVPRILTYRSNWYAAADQFDARFYVDISREIDQKLRLVSLFAGENARTGGSWLDWCRSEARTRGHAAGAEFAEAFGVVKWVAGLPAGSPDL